MDRGYESYNLMAHFKKRDGFISSAFEMGNNLCVPPSTCQIQSVLIKHFLTLSRKQTNQLKNFIVIFPMTIILFHTILLLIFFQKQVKNRILVLYELPFRMVRLEVEEGKIRNFSDKYRLFSPKLKISTPADGGIETSFRDLKYSVSFGQFSCQKKEGFSKKSLLVLQILTFVVG